MFGIGNLKLSLIIGLKSVLIYYYFKTDNSITISVNTSNGVINGKILTSLEGKEITVFKGIPYAEPPVGGLRFKRPVPVKHRDKPIDAFDFGNSCIQGKNIVMRVFGGFKTYREDCLYLNIWSPNTLLNAQSLKPVLFWIHGGGLQFGSSSLSEYNGEALVAKGDVVVVSINYRLGTLGFLYTGTDDSPGNMGLWDQALALQWVNDNIRYFGGDPKQITIFGESAGSWSTSVHILSPISRHLYKNAIMNSGAISDVFLGGKPEENVKRWIKGAQKVGCADEFETGAKFTNKIIDCLMNLSPDQVQEITRLPEKEIKRNRLGFLIVQDGILLPKTPFEMLKSGDFKQDINLMISTTSDEGSLILVMEDVYNYNPFFPKKFTYSEGIDELKQITSELLQSQAINIDNEIEAYFSPLKDHGDYDAIRSIIGTATGDYRLLCPTIEFAKQVFKFSNFSANVYQYLYNSECYVPFCAKWMGVSHFSDVKPMFGIPFLNSYFYSDKDRQISSQMMEIITTFAKKGAPPHQNGIHWPKYHTIGDKEIITAPYYEITTDPKPTTNFGLNYKHNECENLWKKYL